MAILPTSSGRLEVSAHAAQISLSESCFLLAFPGPLPGCWESSQRQKPDRSLDLRPWLPDFSHLPISQWPRTQFSLIDSYYNAIQCQSLQVLKGKNGRTVGKNHHLLTTATLNHGKSLKLNASECATFPRLSLAPLQWTR